MAANSIREQILVAIVAAIDTITAIKKVDRKQPQDVSDLRKYANTQMPLACVIGGVPQPIGHESSRTRGGSDHFLSSLKIELFFYIVERDNPDTVLSSFLDDVWRVLHANQTLGIREVQSLKLMPKVDKAIWDPYLGFAVDCLIEYEHTKGGI